jgi:hypothetical protein
MPSGSHMRAAKRRPSDKGIHVFAMTLVGMGVRSLLSASKAKVPSFQEKQIVRVYAN